MPTCTVHNFTNTIALHSQDRLDPDAVAEQWSASREKLAVDIWYSRSMRVGNMAMVTGVACMDCEPDHECQHTQYCIVL